MTRQSQKNRISEINDKLIIMSNLVQEQICNSMISLKNANVKLAESVIKGDDKVDELQRIIEEECIKFIATEQPLATDLRSVFTSSKIVTDLERMADHATDICKIAIKLGESNNKFEDKELCLWKMEKKVREMINFSLEAYINEDTERAYEICKMDDEIDCLYGSIFTAILKNINVNNSTKDRSAQLLFVAKYLERIADHVTNICEWIIFSKKGIYVDLNE